MHMRMHPCTCACTTCACHACTCACHAGHGDVVRALLRHGALADETSLGHGWTPLLLACQHGPRALS